ncbi:oxidoreductase [Sulfobacillus acidophilus TPY]|nr:oxidoreductase [Sulfobacillus acidophilus TPY]
MMPRFQGENLHRHLEFVDALRQVANEKGVSVAQLSIAWVLSRGTDIIPLIGARRPDQLSETLEALQITLTEDEVTRIEVAIPIGAVAGTRYAAAQMEHLDSERPKPPA